MKTVFIMTHIPNPRMNKRMGIFRSLGSVEVICVRRNEQDIWEQYYKDIPHHIINIDMPNSSDIIGRVKATLKYKKYVVEQLNKIKPDLLYVEGLDTLLIAELYKLNSKIIYECADIRESMISPAKTLLGKIQRKIINTLEKKLLKNIVLLVITSELFYDRHFSKYITKEKVFFFPNVPNEEVFKKYKRKENGVFTVGFIGGIRYMDQMKMLVDAACSTGANVFFAGASAGSESQEIYGYCKDMPNVKFTGKYRYNEEISGLYSQVDCVYAVYDADNPNVRIALPNKLYESAMCGLPIIVAKQTYLSEIVENHQLGFTVAHNNQEELEYVLKELMKNKNVNQNIIFHCEEFRKLYDLNRYNEKFINRIGSI